MVAKVLQDMVAEYEATETLESRLAHDADKIELFLQAIEYQSQGHDTEPWKESSLSALRTDAGRQLARAVGTTDPRTCPTGVVPTTMSPRRSDHQTERTAT